MRRIAGNTWGDVARRAWRLVVSWWRGDSLVCPSCGDVIGPLSGDRFICDLELDFHARHDCARPYLMTTARREVEGAIR